MSSVDTKPSASQLQDGEEVVRLIDQHCEGLHVAMGNAVCEYLISQGIDPTTPTACVAYSIVMVRSAFAMLRTEPSIPDPKALIQWVVDGLPAGRKDAPDAKKGEPTS